MSSYQDPNARGIDPMNMPQARPNFGPMGQPGAFDQAMGMAGYVSALAAPPVVAGLHGQNHINAANVIAAATNGVAVGNASIAAGGAQRGLLGSGPYGSGAIPISGGVGGVGASGPNDVINSVQSNMQDNQVFTAQMMAVQQEIGHQSVKTTAFTNYINMKTRMEKGIVDNFRA